jgi:hypothetical protein
VRTTTTETDDAVNDISIKCARCGAENRASRIFCSACGVYLGEDGTTLDENTSPTTHPARRNGQPVADTDGGHGSAAGDETRLMPSWMLPVDEGPAEVRGGRSTRAAASLSRSTPMLPYWEEIPLDAPIPVPLHEGGAAKPPKRRGSWIVGVLLALLVIALAVAAGSFVYRTVKSAPPSGTTTTATTTAGQGATSTTELVGQVPIPTVSTETTTGETTTGNRLDPSEVLASSSLAPTSTHTYGAHNLLDGKLATAWNENAPGDGEGEWVRFGFAGIVSIARIDVANGYQSDPTTYANNPRVKELRLTFSDGSSQRVTLQDKTGYQTIELTKPKKIEWFRLTIVSTFPGDKWHDAALSEVRFYETVK